MLGKIQTRDMSKNFLQSFYFYLSSKDFKKIRKDFFSKGNIISNKIKRRFSKSSKKRNLEIVLALIDKSFNSLTKVNYYAHSLIIDKYENEITECRKNNNLDLLNNSGIFCFLLGFGIEKKYFEESFGFLKMFFNSDLKLIKEKNFLDVYLK